VKEFRRGRTYTFSMAKFPPNSDFNFNLHGTRVGDNPEQIGTVTTAMDGTGDFKWAVPEDFTPAPYYASASSIFVPNLGVNTPIMTVSVCEARGHGCPRHHPGLSSYSAHRQQDAHQHGPILTVPLMPTGEVSGCRQVSVARRGRALRRGSNTDDCSTDVERNCMGD
jgi:hypothetical protein